MSLKSLLPASSPPAKTVQFYCASFTLCCLNPDISRHVHTDEYVYTRLLIGSTPPLAFSDFLSSIFCKRDTFNHFFALAAPPGSLMECVASLCLCKSRLSEGERSRESCLLISCSPRRRVPLCIPFSVYK